MHRFWPVRFRLPTALAAVGCVLSAAACVPGGQTHATAPDEGLEEVAGGLEIPWALGFAPDGTIFVTERVGRVRVIRNGRLDPEPWASLPVANWRAAGLSGLAVSPDFAETGHVFVMATFRGGDGFVNRIHRFTDRHGRGAEALAITEDIHSIDTHAGGALAFGPDGMLYAALGDAERPVDAQRPDLLIGKILRLHPDGTVPDDNPTPGSPVFALGLRNLQGFAWEPMSGAFFATEHGPSDMPGEDGREHEDELNVIVAGGNYGWPLVSGLHHDGRFLKPVVEWSPAIAPSGLAVAPWSAADRVTLFVGGLTGQQLRRIDLQRSPRGGWIVRAERAHFGRELGRIRAVAFGPDGRLYFTTSNTDTPGEPVRKLARPGDDRIYRIRVSRDDG